MSQLIAEFEDECRAVDEAPETVLKAAGVHPSLWWKWRTGKVSPTLKSFEKARAKLAELRERRAA